MPDRPFDLNIPCRGTIDTAMPISDRPPGTLVSALDLSPRSWGPRRGAQAFSRSWESPGTASLYDEFYLSQSVATFFTGQSTEDQFRDLGLQFTVDLLIQYADVAYAPAANVVFLYCFAPGSGMVSISIRGPNHADREKVIVELITTPTRTTTDTLVTFTGTTRIPYGTAQTDKVHIRVVRDGASAYLYINGVLDGSTSSLVSTSPIFSQLGSVGSLTLGYSNSSLSPAKEFKGRIYLAELRDGAFTAAPIENVVPVNPWAPNVHHCHLGRSYALGGSVYHWFDAGRFAIHLREAAAGYTITASNDNAAPAPAYVQGICSWTTRSNRMATTVTTGGQISTAGTT